MFSNYALQYEQSKYAVNNYAIFEQTKVEDFISHLDPKEVERVIRSFADSRDRKAGGIAMIGGKKIKVSFAADPSEAGAYIANFSYVDNPKASEDLAELIKIAIRGASTDEDQVYAVASAYRQYCQDLGKNEVAEMQKIAQSYKKTYGVDLSKDLWDDFDDTFSQEEFQNFMMKGLFLQGAPGEVGEAHAKRIVDYTKPDFAARMLVADKDYPNAIEFILSCPLKYLRPINDALKAINGGQGLFDLVKNSKYSGDVKDLTHSYMMGAGLVKRSSEFEHAARVAVEGVKKLEPSYTALNDVAL